MANFIKDRNKPRVKRDERGHTTVQHFDGRKDVHIVVPRPVRSRVTTQEK